MKRFFKQAFIFIASTNISIVTFVLIFFAISNQIVFALLGATGVFLLSHVLLKRKLLPNDEIDKIEREEKKYVLAQIREAKVKVKKLNSTRFKVRSIFVYQNITKLYKISLKVIKMVENEPIRYRTAQKFIQQHLDSSAIIAEKYVHLLSQPVRTHEVSAALRETENTLKQLERSMEKELMTVLSGDMHNLNTEIKLMNQNTLTIEKK
ncbi:5-bromo-4-chloroindolyl phosphate hydrolysis family protein [Sutcliffiella deserti]|uniref:5-bromo-4-chloroindolyl phosphate hydrolysis family protein n=1 Tax=Sutcliffiella deserti TaxID=2875501 RepID=UPI001CBADB21|nr:5-bromo-4-chloroindolyl phosphate hydrolysis family protein [Sutcliffiella deserti]